MVQWVIKQLLQSMQLVRYSKKTYMKNSEDYSNKYPIAADMHFILKAYLGNAKFIYHDQELGEYGC